jgi:hypothetical protein
MATAERRCSKQREGKCAGRVIEPRKMHSCGQRISSCKRTQSRRYPVNGRQQSYLRQGKRVGHHRGLRAGHAFKGVIRELGRASRLLGSERRSKDDRHQEHPGNCYLTQAAVEPTPATAEGNTKQWASNQGTGREPKANQPGRTKAVVATRSTASLRAARPLGRTRGEPRPKGPTIKAARQREGEVGHDLWAREIQE